MPAKKHFSSFGRLRGKMSPKELLLYLKKKDISLIERERAANAITHDKKLLPTQKVELLRRIMGAKKVRIRTPEDLK